MATIMDYLDWRGDLTFDRDPFNEVDNLILSEMVYTDFDGIVPSSMDESISVREASEAFFQMHSREELLARESFIKMAPFVLEKMSATARFGDIKLSGYVNYIDTRSEAQMAVVSCFLPDGTVYAPVTDADGVRSAQLMFVVGTDEAGADHPGWRDNLALALRLQTALSDWYPTLMRDVNLRSASFNEQYAKGSLLIEAGAAGCTLDEALASVDLLADALIGEIRGEG